MSTKMDTDLLCTNTHRGWHGCKEEMLCLQRKFQLFFKAELALPEDTEELNPPVRRERFPWGETLQEDKEDTLQELQHFHSKHQTPSEWPVRIPCCFPDTQFHCWTGSADWWVVRNRKRSKWVCGTMGSQLTQDLRGRGRSWPPLGIQPWRL